MIFGKETKPCPCGRRMIPVPTGVVLCSHPARHLTRWTCYACLREEPGPYFTEEGQHAVYRRIWEAANV